MFEWDSCLEWYYEQIVRLFKKENIIFLNLFVMSILAVLGIFQIIAINNSNELNDKISDIQQKSIITQEKLGEIQTCTLLNLMRQEKKEQFNLAQNLKDELITTRNTFTLQLESLPNQINHSGSPNINYPTIRLEQAIEISDFCDPSIRRRLSLFRQYISTINLRYDMLRKTGGSIYNSLRTTKTISQSDYNLQKEHVTGVMNETVDLLEGRGNKPNINILIEDIEICQQGLNKDIIKLNENYEKCVVEIPIK